MAVRTRALPASSRRTMGLHGKQKAFSKDAKIYCSLQLNIAIPRFSMLLSDSRRTVGPATQGWTFEVLWARPCKRSSLNLLTNYIWESQIAHRNNNQRSSRNREQFQKRGVEYTRNIERELSSLNYNEQSYKQEFTVDQKVIRLIYTSMITP